MPDTLFGASPVNQRAECWQAGRSGDAGRRIASLCAGLALAMAACTSEEAPTDPAGGPSLSRATASAYTAVDLSRLDQEFSEAMDIGPSGRVVGQRGRRVTVDGNSTLVDVRAVIWDRGAVTELGTLGGSFSGAFGINAQGQIVGQSENASGETHAFLWTRGLMTDLGTLGGVFSAATAINSRGQVVGESGTPADDIPHAFFWENGVMTDLHPVAGILSHASDINQAGGRASPGISRLSCRSLGKWHDDRSGHAWGEQQLCRQHQSHRPGGGLERDGAGRHPRLPLGRRCHD